MLLRGPKKKFWAVQQPCGKAAVAYVGPGDVISGATFFCSCARAYTAAFAATNGAIIQIGDNLGANPTDIHVTSAGFVNLTEIASWVASFGSTIRVLKVYDQTGNGWTFTNATVSRTPILTTAALNGLPVMTFTNAATAFLESAAFTQTQPFNMMGVYRRTSNATNQTGILMSQSSLIGFGPQASGTSANTAYLSSGGIVNLTGVADSSWHAAQAVFASGTATMAADGSSASGAVGSTGISAVNMRIARGSAASLDGDIAEVGFWPTTGWNSTQFNNINSNQHSAANGYNF